MIIDNDKISGEQLKLHEWISQFSTTGKMDIVTGYFTVGALAWLSKTVNEKVSEYRFLLGDIVQSEVLNDRTLDLLNENISIEGALKLNKLAKEAPDDGKTDSKKSKELAKLAPVLMLLKQKGNKSNGWRDAPFYWPVLVMPENMPNYVYCEG